MATVNLGKIKPTWRNAWASGTAYTVDDMVSHGGTSYMCISNVTGTTTPNADTSNWDTMAGKGDIGVTGAQGTTGNTGSQGPIGNTGPSGFPSGGTAGQVVTNTSSGIGTWQDVAAGGKVLQVVTNTMAGTSNSTSSTGWTFTGLFVDITPQSTNSKIIVLYDHGIGFNNSTGNARIEYQLFSASDSDVLVMKKYTGAEINGVPSFTQRMAISGSGSYINSSTAPKTFKLQVRPADGNSGECSAIYYNWYSGAEHSMIAMEVSA